MLKSPKQGWNKETDARIDENIQMRHDKGIGNANQILSILT